MNNDIAGIDQLNILNSSFTKLSLKLRELGKEQEADVLLTKIQVMTLAIENLTKKALNEWSAESSTIIEDVKKCNTQVGNFLNELSRKINIAENCIKAVSLIDQITIRIRNAV